MIEDTIQAVKAAEEEAKKKVSDAREKAHEIALAGDSEIADLYEAAKAGDKSFYDNEMQLAAQKADEILSAAQAKAAEEKQAIESAAAPQEGAAVDAVIEAVLAQSR